MAMSSMPTGGSLLCSMHRRASVGYLKGWTIKTNNCSIFFNPHPNHQGWLDLALPIEHRQSEERRAPLLLLRQAPVV